MNNEHVYRCNATVKIVTAEGLEVGFRPCGNKFSSNIELDKCPKCFSDDITEIPVVFLKLWDSDRSVRYYVTETMELRTGLTAEEAHIGRQILSKYGGISAGQLEYCI